MSLLSVPSEVNSDINQIRAWLPAIIITAGIIAFGIILQKLAIAYFHRTARKDRWRGGLVFVSSLRGMIVLISVIVGIYVGLVNSPLPQTTLLYVEKFHRVIIILITTIILGRVIKGMFRAYTQREEGIKRSLSLFNTIISITVYSVGGMVVLDAMGISITPIITALGVGGLAVALALQDTLSNLFAGIHITIAHILKPGDYILLSSGEEGTVSDITWRCTTLTTQSNNVVVIPNSKLAATIVTNYSLPEKSLDISVLMNISYNCDLEKVEKVTLDEVCKVMQEMGMQKTDPTFRVKELGEFAVKCGVSVTVHEFKQQYIARHNIIKHLHKRYKQEGIEIAFPARNVMVKKES
jgi:small-conductance mechanosensitive channel